MAEESWRTRVGKAYAERRRIEKEKAMPPALPFVGPVLPLEFSTSVCAIPTIGGIVTDLPLSRHSELRFPKAVQLPVTIAAAARAAKPRSGGTWMVVEYEGRGVAMTVREAFERGLKEAPCWIPDLTGITGVPGIGDIERILDAQQQ